DGACGVQFELLGSHHTKDPSQACKATECDGNGNFKPVADQSNLPVLTNDCQIGTCDQQGNAGMDNQPAGMACNGGVCDGAGKCVACLMSSDCMNGKSCTSQHICVDPSCTNGVQDQGETDSDCGGSTSCNRCVTGKKCLMGSDCLDKICSQGT